MDLRVIGVSGKKKRAVAAGELRRALRRRQGAEGRRGTVRQLSGGPPTSNKPLSKRQGASRSEPALAGRSLYTLRYRRSLAEVLELQAELYRHLGTPQFEVCCSVDFHIEDVGQGRPVLFIHAGVADSRMWREQLGLDGFRTIAFDKRGFGRTPWVAGDYSDTDDALAVLDALGVDTAVIVGCSMGGATALDLAIHHPERVDGLVLVGAFPSGWEPEEGWDEVPLEAEAEKAAEAGDFARVVEIDYQMWLVGYGRKADDIDPAHKELFFEMDSTPARNEAERVKHQKGFTARLNEHLDDIDVPTLVVVGAHDEPILVKAAHHLADKLSDGQAVVLDGAAHLPSIEVPDAFNTHLLNFLNG